MFKRIPNSTYLSQEISRNLLFIIRQVKHENMSSKTKKKGKKEASAAPGNSNNKSEQGPVLLDKANNLLIKILAKPGAKQNGVTDISSEGVGIQINAPPTEGEANTELCKYIASILGVRKGDVSLDKGFKSRQKTVRIEQGSIDIQQVVEKLRAEIDNNG